MPAKRIRLTAVKGTKRKAFAPSTYSSNERETHTLKFFHTLVASLSFAFSSYSPTSRACYLSFISEKEMSTVLRHIDDDVEYVAPEWRGVVGEGEGVNIVGLF